MAIMISVLCGMLFILQFLAYAGFPCPPLRNPSDIFFGAWILISTRWRPLWKDPWRREFRIHSGPLCTMVIPTYFFTEFLSSFWMPSLSVATILVLSLQKQQQPFLMRRIPRSPTMVTLRGSVCVTGYSCSPAPTSWACSSRWRSPKATPATRRDRG